MTSSILPSNDEFTYYLQLHYLFEPCKPMTKEDVVELYGSFCSVEHYLDFLYDTTLYERQYQNVIEARLPLRPLVQVDDSIISAHIALLDDDDDDYGIVESIVDIGKAIDEIKCE